MVCTGEEEEKYQELRELYVHQKKTVFEIAPVLGIASATAYERLVRLGIPIRKRKPHYSNGRILQVPSASGDLAEFCGPMLGDGHIGSGQLLITVNIKTDSP